MQVINSIRIIHNRLIIIIPVAALHCNHRIFNASDEKNFLTVLRIIDYIMIIIMAGSEEDNRSVPSTVAHSPRQRTSKENNY